MKKKDNGKGEKKKTTENEQGRERKKAERTNERIKKKERKEASKRPPKDTQSPIASAVGGRPHREGSRGPFRLPLAKHNKGRRQTPAGSPAPAETSPKRTATTAAALSPAENGKGTERNNNEEEK